MRIIAVCFTVIAAVFCFNTHFVYADRDSSAAIQTIKVPAAPGSATMINVDLYVPSGVKIRGDLLVLPGWKYSRTRWHQETNLIHFADRFGFRCVFPEMNTSCYESAYFPETRMKWSIMPGGAWVREILIPFMQKNHEIFAEKNFNCVLGLSTGARGAALVSLQNPKIFKAAAALSGDYNQATMPQDKLMAAIYGDFESFRKRWQSVDNPYMAALIGEWKIPIYIGHGDKDAVTPESQSRHFSKMLKTKYMKLDITYNSAYGFGHDFKYWDSELDSIFKFFNRVK